MRTALTLFLLAFTMLIPGSETQAAVISPTFSTQIDSATEGHIIPTLKQKRPGFFEKFRAIKALKKRVREQTESGEKPSKLALVALTIFAASVIVGAFSNALPVFGYLSLLGILASNIMAMIVLFGNENKNSRKIARGILIATLVMLILAVLVTIALLLFLIAILG
jgi:hypothetical protein